MKQTVKILFTDLSYLNHNYGVQGIALPLMQKLDKYFNAEYTFVLPERHYEDNLSFSKKYNVNIIPSPAPLVVLGRHKFLIGFIYNLVRLLKRRRIRTDIEKEQCSALVKKFEESDVVIDISGIEFVRQTSLRGRYLNNLKTICMQYLAKKNDKPYFKYTKSYGPFVDKIYKFFVKKQLNELPFVFVRGENNLEIIKELNLKVPVYSFPDISISLEPENKEWAIDCITKLGINPSKPIIGISPSSVIAGIKINKNNLLHSCGLNYIRLCKEIINFYQLKGLQVLLIPHSLGDGKDIRSCDLALSKKIYSELRDKTNIFMISSRGLTYKQVRAIIGLLDFYISSRYHSVSSALSMGIPVVSLSWHIKYQDIMSLFLDNFLTMDCKTTGIKKALSLIEKYYNNRKWFDKNKVLKRKEQAIKQIDKSVDILANEIKKYI